MITRSSPKNDRPEGLSAPEARLPTPDQRTVATAGHILTAPHDPRADTLGKIRTSFIYPPIPPRQFDWCAWRDGDEPDDNGHMRQGFGATEQEAIAELLMLEEDDGL